jgi:ADP-ribosyl-[dinitrogen reductase] hydrolase
MAKKRAHRALYERERGVRSAEVRKMAAMERAWTQAHKAHAAPPPAESFTLLRADGSEVRIEVTVGDITDQAVDAIVNPSNRGLFGTAGVDGAVHRRGGPELTAACREIGGIKYGQAVVTPGFRLPAGRVIHTTTHPWKGGGFGELATLEAAYAASFEIARRLRLRTWRSPPSAPAPTATRSTPRPRSRSPSRCASAPQPGELALVRFVLFEPPMAELYRRVWAQAVPQAASPRAGGGVVTALGPGAADRIRGALLGLAAGDAVGTTVEFQRARQLRAPHRHGRRGALRPAARRLDRRHLDGGLPRREPRRDTAASTPPTSCGATCAGTARATGASPGAASTSAAPPAARSSASRRGRPGHRRRHARTHSAANGSIMRLAPVPVAFARDPAEAVRLAGESSRTTHALPVCVDACRYLGGLLVGAVRGATKRELLAPGYAPAPGLWDAGAAPPEIAAVAAGSFRAKAPPAIRGTGHVVASLEAALWAFATTDDYAACVLAAANLGDDADTTAADRGAAGGRPLRRAGIPPRWRARLALRERLEALADGLVGLAEV